VVESLTDFDFIDDITYGYGGNSNQLKFLYEASGSNKGFKNGTNKNIEYYYDDSGNMIKELNKGIVGPRNY
jgi:hypothetical protein